MKKELNMNELIIIIKNKRRMIIVIILLFTLLGTVFGLMVPPTYEAKTDILVNYKSKDNESTLQSNEIDMSLRLIETYKYMLKSDRMLKKVINEVNETYTPTELRRKISIDSIDNSQIISIIAVGKTPDKAALLVNTYANTFQEEIKTLMNLDNISILNEITSESDMKVIKIASVLVVIISFMIGIIIAIMTVFVQEFYFAKLNSTTRSEIALNIPTLGVVPKIKNKKRNKRSNNIWEGKLISDLKSPELFSEEFRKMRANIKFQMSKKDAKTILVTSTAPGDGKSLISVNLAIIMALGGDKTVFIDADLRSPIGRKPFNLPERKGLTSVISGAYDIDDVIQETGTKNLRFISSGPIPPNPAEVLSSNEMKKFMKNLKGKFDVIIIDTSSLVVADVISLSTEVDGCLYVIDATKTKEEQAKKDLERLHMVEAPVLGTVLNRGFSTSTHIAYNI